MSVQFKLGVAIGAHRLFPILSILYVAVDLNLPPSMYLPRAMLLAYLSRSGTALSTSWKLKIMLLFPNNTLCCIWFETKYERR